MVEFEGRGHDELSIVDVLNDTIPSSGLPNGSLDLVGIFSPLRQTPSNRGLVYMCHKTPISLRVRAMIDH